METQFAIFNGSLTVTPSGSTSSNSWSPEDSKNLFLAVREKLGPILNQCQFTKNSSIQESRLAQRVTVPKGEKFYVFLCPPSSTEHPFDILILNSKPEASGSSKEAYTLLDGYKVVKKDNQYGYTTIDQQVKAYAKAHYIFLVNKQPSPTNKFKEEHNTLRLCDSKHVVKSYGVLHDATAQRSLMIQERGGISLLSYLNRIQSLSLQDFATITTQILKGLQDLSDSKLGIYDTKLANIVINEKKEVRFTDPGGMVVQNEQGSLELNDSFTPPYADPTILFTKFLILMDFHGTTPQTINRLLTLKYRHLDPDCIKKTDIENIDAHKYLLDNFSLRKLSVHTLNTWTAATIILQLATRVPEFNKTTQNNDSFMLPWSESLKELNIKLNPLYYKLTGKVKNLETIQNTPIETLIKKLIDEISFERYLDVPPNSPFANFFALLSSSISIDLGIRPRVRELIEALPKELQPSAHSTERKALYSSGHNPYTVSTVSAGSTVANLATVNQNGTTGDSTLPYSATTCVKRAATQDAPSPKKQAVKE